MIVSCSILRIGPYSHTQFKTTEKIIALTLILKTFRHFKTQKGKLCNDDINRASVL